jgi:NMD protein affecting ribosome stability and mRNA decay
MSKVTGSCTCGRHSYTIPKPTEMNLCRMCYEAEVITSHTNNVQTVEIARNGPEHCEYPAQIETEQD